MKTITYGRQYIDDFDINEVIETLKSDFLTQGPKIKQFEDKVAKYHNCKYAVAFCNGTAALHGAYYVLDLKVGDEIITSPITFAASSNAALYLGAIPKFVDIDKENYNIDISQIERNITNKTKIITPVSFAGFPVDLKKIKDIIKKTGKDIKIIHDAAHAIGAIRNNDDIVKYSDMTILSFHPVKHITTGEGGMVLTNNEEYYKRLCLFRTHGITKDKNKLLKQDGPWYYEMQELGYNYRITDIQCALGISQMDKLNYSLYRRNQIAQIYDKELKNIDWLKLPNNYFNKDWLEKVEYQNLNNKPLNLNSYHLYPILLENSDIRLKFYEYMKQNNIILQVHYIPVHLMPYYREQFGYKEGDFPNAENFYAREISLPMFPSLTDEELYYIIEKIKTFKYEGKK